MARQGDRRQKAEGRKQKAEEVLPSAYRLLPTAQGLAAGLLFLLNPPSLSGAGGFATLLVGTLAFVLLCAWAFVALLGRDAMPEDEFERLVRRSEELARHPRLAEEATEFELLVADAIDRLPPEFQRVLETTPVVVSQRGAEHVPSDGYEGLPW